MRTRVIRRSPVVERRQEPPGTEIYYWWLLVALFFEYARPASFLSGLAVMKLNSLIPLSLLAAVLLAKGLRPFGEIYQDTGSRWLTAYLGLMVISIPIAAVTTYAIDTFTGVLGYYFLFLIVSRVVTSFRRMYGVFAVLIAAHLFLIAMTPEIILRTDTRSYIKGGTFLGDGNDFGLSVCILLPMALGIAQRARSRLKKLIGWGSLVVLLLAVVGTQSRGATVGLIGVAAFLWLASSRKLASMLIILVGGAIVAFHASDAYFARMGSISNYKSDGSAEGRIVVWKASLRMALDNPLFGVGLGNFPTEFGAKYRPKDLAMPQLTAHSTYFLVLGELGPPGLIVVLILVVGGARATLRVRRRVITVGAKQASATVDECSRTLYLLVGSVIGFGVAGAFLSAAYYPHLFVLTGILVSARNIAAREIAVGEAAADAGGRQRLDPRLYRRAHLRS